MRSPDCYKGFFSHLSCTLLYVEHPHSQLIMSADNKHPQPTTVLGLDEVRDEKLQPLSKRIKNIVWDTLEYTPQERRLITKLDFFILTWAGFSYFSKNLNSKNVSNAYVSGMKEEINVVGNEYQTFTTMWTMYEIPLSE